MLERPSHSRLRWLTSASCYRGGCDKVQLNSLRVVSTSSPGSVGRASKIGFYNRSIIAL